MRGRQSKRKASRSTTTAQLDLFSRSLIAFPASVAAIAEAEQSEGSASLGRSLPKPISGARHPHSEIALANFVLTGRRRGRPEKSLNEEGDAAPEESDLVDVREAAKILGLSKSTLDKMRCSGKGPPFVRATDRAVRYDPKDLKAFKKERRYRSTSDLAGLSAD